VRLLCEPAQEAANRIRPAVSDPARAVVCFLAIRGRSDCRRALPWASHRDRATDAAVHPFGPSRRDQNV